MIDLLLTHGDVFTMAGDGVGYIENGAVAIEGNRIVAVGPSPEIQEKYQARRTIDATMKAVLPGLIDVETIDRLIDQVLKGVSGQSVFGLPVPGLTHPFLKMGQMHLRVVGDIPDHIIPVSSFDPVFPPMVYLFCSASEATDKITQQLDSS